MTEFVVAEALAELADAEELLSELRLTLADRAGAIPHDVQAKMTAFKEWRA